MKGITTVVFDIGNVLAGFDWQTYLRQFGFPKETEDRIAAATFLGKNWQEVDRGAKTDEEIYADCLREIPDLEKELSMVWDRRLEIVKEYEYSADWIQMLKEKGYRVYLLSNYGKTAFTEVKRKFSFLQYPDGMVISYEIKHIKPEKEIYEELIRRYAVVPEEAVFIDDLPANLEAAKEMGFHTILFTEKEEVERKLWNLAELKKRM